jgi:hypothetical protein
MPDAQAAEYVMQEITFDGRAFRGTHPRPVRFLVDFRDSELVVRRVAAWG